MPRFSALGVLLLASVLPAQRGVFTVFPDVEMWSATFIDRGAMSQSGNAGEVLSELPRGLVRGIGNGVRREIDTIQIVLQDQNAATTETFSVVIRPRDASGVGPDPNLEQLRIDNLVTPAGTGEQAWLINVTFNPVQVRGDGWFVGVVLPIAPTWPFGDGIAVQMADYDRGTVGDHPRASAPELGWSIDAQTPVPASHRQCWAIAVGTPAPTLQIGGLDPSNTRTSTVANQGAATFGAGGFFPDVGGQPRRDGLILQVYDDANRGASTAAVVGFQLPAQPIPVPGVVGSLLIGGGLLGFPGSPISGAGLPVSRFVVTPPGSIPVELAGRGFRAYFQAIVLDPSNGPTLTNMVGTEF